jgi:hypothetical protein
VDIDQHDIFCDDRNLKAIEEEDGGDALASDKFHVADYEEVDLNEVI